MFQEKIEIFFPLPSALATSALGISRLESHVLFGPKESMETYPGCWRLYLHLWLRPAGRRIQPPARKPLVPRVRERSFIC